MGNPYLDVVEIALVPAIIFFLFGWGIGTTDTIMSHHVDGINRYTLMVSLPATALMTLTLEFFDFSELLFIVPFVIHKVICAILFALPSLCWKKMSLELYNLLQLNANYSNNIVFGNAFLIALYPKYSMGLLCILSAVPDSMGIFPYSLFVFEFNKLKKQFLSASKNGHIFSFKDSLSLIPKVLFRVMTNGVVWGMLLGVIFNFSRTVLPVWMKTTVDFAGRSNFAVVMFNIGLFSAHAPGIKINWASVKDKLRHRFKRNSPSPRFRVEGEEAKTAPDVRGGGNTDAEGRSFAAEQEHTQTIIGHSIQDQSIQEEAITVDVLEKGGEIEMMDISSDPADDSLRAVPFCPQPSPVTRTRHNAGDTLHAPSSTFVALKNSAFDVYRPSGSVAAPAQLPSNSTSLSSPPHHLDTSPSPPLRKPSALLVFMCCLIRYVVSPLIMLPIAALLPLRPDQKHAAVLVNALPLSVVAFALSKEFQSYTPDVCLAIVIQSFVLIFPMVIAWFNILNKMWPLE